MMGVCKLVVVSGLFRFVLVSGLFSGCFGVRFVFGLFYRNPRCRRRCLLRSKRGGYAG